MLPVKLLSPDAKLPQRAHDIDAGLDLFSCEDVMLHSYDVSLWQQFIQDIYRLFFGKDFNEKKDQYSHLFNVNVAVAIPPGKVGLILDKSGFGGRLIKVFGGVIDSGYTGSLYVKLANFGDGSFEIKKGKAIAQLVIVDCCLEECQAVNELPEYSERKEKGFGSTG